ncbi:hypothetical protein ACFFQW_02800 [Umezawaea endophytica]|uniref:Uncharacterized protein n=1 Tax=Umezawaea endophytica TaxID=1654476 RepID=A0A9X3AI49_9PSEU|nr:hypothetical protein [Umezawaea endophytica]MCS7482026.1 hypothetical protein [Umezawaea endophytica]
MEGNPGKWPATLFGAAATTGKAVFGTWSVGGREHFDSATTQRVDSYRRNGFAMVHESLGRSWTITRWNNFGGAVLYRR